MNPPQVYMCSPSWTLPPPPSPIQPSGSSQCTSPKHPISCIEPGLVTHFIYDIIHVSMPFSQIFPPSPSLTESKRLFYTSVSLLLSRIQGYCYHLSKFHIYALVSNEVDETGAYYTEWSKPERKTPVYSILMHIYGIQKDGNNNPVYETAEETLMYRTVFWTLWERERVGWFGRMALKHV